MPARKVLVSSAMDDDALTEPVGDGTRVSRYRSIALLAGLGLAIGIANKDTLAALWSLWTSGGHEQGPVVALGVVWLLWSRRSCLARMTWCADPRGLVGLLAATCAGIVAHLASIQVLAFLALPVLLVSSVWTVLGRGAARLTAGPLLLLVLALPVTSFLEPLLQLLTVNVVALILRLFGIPVFVDDTYLESPAGSIVVLATCGGEQFFRAGVVLGAFYAFINLERAGLRIACIAVFCVMSMVGNWLRVLTLVFVGRLGLIEHMALGWGWFAALLVLSFWIGSRLQRMDRPAPAAREARRALWDRRSEETSQLWVTIASASIVLMGPVVIEGLVAMESSRVDAAVSLPSVRSPWNRLNAVDPLDQVDFNGATSESNATYESERGIVVLTHVYYASQSQGHEAINELNLVYDPANWRPRGGFSGSIYQRPRLGSGLASEVIETRLENMQTGAQRLVWHWYIVGGKRVTRPGEAKLAQLWGILHGRTAAEVIVISTESTDLDVARQILEEFLGAMKR